MFMAACSSYRTHILPKQRKEETETPQLMQIRSECTTEAELQKLHLELLRDGDDTHFTNHKCCCPITG